MNTVLYSNYLFYSRARANDHVTGIGNYTIEFRVGSRLEYMSSSRITYQAMQFHYLMA